MHLQVSVTHIPFFHLYYGLRVSSYNSTVISFILSIYKFQTFTRNSKIIWDSGSVQYSPTNSSMLRPMSNHNPSETNICFCLFYLSQCSLFNNYKYFPYFLWFRSMFMSFRERVGRRGRECFRTRWTLVNFWYCRPILILIRKYAVIQLNYTIWLSIKLIQLLEY